MIARWRCRCGEVVTAPTWSGWCGPDCYIREHRRRPSFECPRCGAVVVFQLGAPDEGRSSVSVRCAPAASAHRTLDLFAANLTGKRE